MARQNDPVTVSVRMSQAERDLLDKRADEEMRTISSYVRWLLMKDVRRAEAKEANGG